MDAIESSSGRINGQIVDGVRVFKGVRYGEAFGADRRFLPARPGVGQARSETSDFGPACPQISRAQSFATLGGDQDFLALLPLAGIPTSEGTESEDCLTLNVWAPVRPGDEPLPVLFWLHVAGDFGSGSWPWYDGTALARSGTVVVTINHRIGPLGHLYLGGLDPDLSSTGNAGLRDVLLALAWVQENIAALGGDPERVTIGGGSAGAVRAAALMCVEGSSSLFHRAILMSPGRHALPTSEVAENYTDQILHALNITSDPIGALRKTDARALVDAWHQVRKQTGASFMMPLIDGDLLDDQPASLLSGGNGSGCPLVTGTTRHEAYVFAPSADWDAIGFEGAATFLEPQLGERSWEVVDAYHDREPELSPKELFATIDGDLGFRLPAIQLAEAHATGGGDAYLYEFGGHSPLFGASVHGLDIPYLFRNLESASAAGPELPHNQALQAELVDRWGGLFANGIPNGPRPAWPQHSPTNRRTLVLEEASHVENDPRAGLIDLLAEVTSPGHGGTATVGSDLKSS